MIGMGSKTLLNQQKAGLPDVSEALREWLQKMNFQLIVKEMVDYVVQETYKPISFDGVWQPMGANQLKMKPEGQRSWQWYTCHTLTAIGLKNDDVIIFQGVEYRVMSFNAWQQYGYYEYHLVKDFEGLEKTEIIEEAP